MEQTIKKYSFMLRMQSIDLSNIYLINHAENHVSMDQSRWSDSVNMLKRCSYYSYHGNDVWKHHRLSDTIMTMTKNTMLSKTNNIRGLAPNGPNTTLML